MPENTHMTISNYLSFLMLKYDCETMSSLVPCLQGNGVVGLGMTPFVSLTAASAQELFMRNNITINVEDSGLAIEDVRLKLKIFENGFSKSKKMILNIDYLQNESFKSKLRFNFLKWCNIHYNLGVYFNNEKKIIGNTQFAYYLTQDDKFIKQNIEKIKQGYLYNPDSFEIDKKVAFDFGHKCGSTIGFITNVLSEFDAPIKVLVNIKKIDLSYTDINTNRKSKLFPNGDEGKALILYLLHTVSLINFTLYILNEFEKNDYGWFLKANYISYYYAYRKIQDLVNYLTQNNMLTQDMSDLLNHPDISEPTYINSSFRNCLMHSEFTDKNGVFLINKKYIDKSKPLFGLVESSFDGIDYYRLKEIIRKKLEDISQLITNWISISNIRIRPLD